MNVEVLGEDSDVMLGGLWDDVGNFFTKTQVGKAVGDTVGQYVQQRMTPTQKAMVQQVTGTSTSVPNPQPPKKTFMEENGTYLIIGGAVLVGAIILMKTRKRSTSVAA